MKTALIQVQVPEHAHRALRIFAATHGTSMSRVVLAALDEKYPSLRCLETQPRAYDPMPQIGVSK